VKLDGLRAAGVYKWPGPIHEGKGEMQIIIDPKATDEQRAALQAIIGGEDTDEMATMWYVYSAMSPTKHETLYRTIMVDSDPAERVGSATVEDVFQINLKPIPNIVSGAPHRVGINLPNGFEFAHAEAASGETRTFGGSISLQKNHDSHAHFASLHLTGSGVVH